MRGALGIALVEDSRLVDGRPVVDVVTGACQMSLEVPVPVLGGAEGTLIYAPQKMGQAVVAHTGGPGSVMIPLTSWPPSGRQGFQEEPVDVDISKAYPADQHTKDDIVIMHRGNKIVLDGQGRLVIHAGSGDIRIQCPERNGVQVHRGEDTTESYLALSGPVADAINTLTRSVADLVTRVSSLEGALVAAVAALPQNGPYGAFTAIGTVQLSAPIPGGAYAPSEIAADAIASPALLVSSETVEG